DNLHLHRALILLDCCPKTFPGATGIGKDEMAMDPTKALVADIGGTHARFAIADLEDMKLFHVAALPSASFDSLQEAARTYLASAPVQPGRACFGLAAPLTGETVQMTNLPWSFTREEL